MLLIELLLHVCCLILAEYVKLYKATNSFETTMMLIGHYIVIELSRYVPFL